MKKLLSIAMMGIMLTGVGCKQTDKVADDIEKNTKQIEEYQEEKKVVEKKDSDEERYAEAEEYLMDVVSQGGEQYGFTVERKDNCIRLTMHLDMNGYKLSDAYAYGYTKQEIYEEMEFETIIDVIDSFAAIGQVETRAQFGDDINVIVDSYFGEDRVYCVDGDGIVYYNYFDEE